MWWNVTLRNSATLAALLVLVLLAGAKRISAADEGLGWENPKLWIVYPLPGQVIGAVDSTFVFGGIAPCTQADDWDLTINDQAVPVHEDGGFLAFVPVEPGEFVFRARARRSGADERSWRERHRSAFPATEPVAEVSCSVAVLVPEPQVSYSTDTLKIGPEYRRSMGDRDLSTGENLDIWVRGTPGCRAWFEIPGVVDSVAMAETEPHTQAYWGEAVFGVGAVPESLLIAGVYSGFWTVPDSVRAESLRVVYHLAPPDRGRLVCELAAPPYDPAGDSVLLEYLAMNPDTTVTDSAGWMLSLNSGRYPFVVEFTDSVQIMRHGPRRGYLGIHQPAGIRAMAVGRVGDWYRVKLSESRYGWVYHESVQERARGILPPKSLLRSIRTYGSEDALTVEFPLGGRHPFRIEEVDRRTVKILLFGVTADTDWIRYDFGDDLVDLASWSQPEPGLYEFTLRLNRDVWGYDTFYEGNTFFFRLNRAPENVWDIRGKRIVIDPGHASDPGAIGPTWLTEAEANLGISLVLREVLERAGAEVIMTRDDMRHVDLYDRPAIAKLAGADLYVSVHNNALPDGVNPFVNNGTSSFYYHPHSIDFARAVHGKMLEATGLDDHGLFHGNLAVIRPTQYPAVLVECAFMMIPEQEALLKTDRYRYLVADAIREGIEEFLREYGERNR